MDKTNLLCRAITSSLEGYSKYNLDGWTYVLLSDKNNWAICYADSGYTFYNNDYFSNLFSYLSVARKNHKRYIHSWVKDVLGVNVDKHCYPDCLYGDYDWSKQFNVRDVLEKGELVP